MSPTLKALGIDHTSIDERIVLANEIWDSLESEPHSLLLSEDVNLLLIARLHDHRSSAEQGIPLGAGTR